MTDGEYNAKTDALRREYMERGEKSGAMAICCAIHGPHFGEQGHGAAAWVCDELGRTEKMIEALDAFRRGAKP